jgi:hypothetical protein
MKRYIILAVWFFACIRGNSGIRTIGPFGSANQCESIRNQPPFDGYRVSACWEYRGQMKTAAESLTQGENPNEKSNQ